MYIIYCILGLIDTRRRPAMICERLARNHSVITQLQINMIDGILNTVRSVSRCALRLQYVKLVVINEVAVPVCCCFTVFSC
jgi:hypothetical protein